MAVSEAERGARGTDLRLLLCAQILIVAGLVFIYSSSQVQALERFGDGFYFVRKQLMWAAFGVVLMLLLSALDYRKVSEPGAVSLALIVTVGLLLLVLLIGPEVKGAKRWIFIGPVSVQPSELAKVAVVLYLAKYGEVRGERLREFREGLLPALLVVGAICGLILKGRHLGNAAIIWASSLLILFLAGARLSHILGLFLLSVALMGVGIVVFKYQPQRILAWLDPWRSPDWWGYHVLRQRMAISSGGLLGQGLGGGLSKYLHLPEAFKESIFSSLAEQVGLVGAGGVLFAFGYLVWCCFDVSRRAPDRLGSLLAGGAGTTLGLQALVNTGVQTGLLPPTGVPLPFMSYGGSCLLASCALVGLALSVSRRAQPLSGGEGVAQGGHSRRRDRGASLPGAGRL